MATRRVTIKAGELTGVRVGKISLVDRGANRVPFRLQKRDGQPRKEGNGVLNFGKLPFSKTDEPKVALGAVAVAAGVDLDSTKELVAKAGYDVEKREWIEAQDGGHVLPLVDDFDPANAQFVKFDDQHGAFLLNAQAILQKAAKSMDFNENLGAAQFIPGLFMSVDALSSTVMKILDEADSKGEATTAIKGATEAFGAALTAMADAIPEDVFKLEAILTTKSEDESGDGEGTGTEAKAQKGDGEGSEAGNDNGESEGKVEKKEDPEGQDAGTADDAGEGKVAKTDPEGDDKGSEPTGEPTLADVLKAVSGVKDAVSSVEKRVEGVEAKVGDIEKAAGEAKDLAKKAGDSVKSITGGLPVGDQPTTSRNVAYRTTRKGDRPSVPLLDTAVSKAE